MKELTSFIPCVMFLMAMLAASTVVSVATLKILRSSYPRVTAVILSLGVTIMALVGTAPVIFAPLAGSEVTEPRFSNGSTLMLPFLTLAVARLLCELLVAASGSAADGRPHPGAMETEAAGKTGAPPAKDSKSAASTMRPRGRPRTQHPQEAQRENHVENVKGTKKPDQVAAVARGN